MLYLTRSQISVSQNLLEHRHGPEVGGKGFHQLRVYVVRNLYVNHGFLISLSVLPW